MHDATDHPPVIDPGNTTRISRQKWRKPGKLRIAQPEDIIYHQTPAVSEFKSNLN